LKHAETYNTFDPFLEYFGADAGYVLLGVAANQVMRLTFKWAYNAVESKSNSCAMPIAIPATEESVMLKPFLFISAVALFSIAPSTVAAAPPPPSQDVAAKVPAKVNAETQAKAQKLYARDCALCHGDSGDGKTDIAKDMQLTLIDWTDPKSLADKQDQELFKIIRDGKDKMPAENSGRAKDDDVWNLVVYIRGFSKNHRSAPATPAAAGTTSAPGN
jgi:mono/diheme cytochrome c family protein